MSGYGAEPQNNYAARKAWQEAQLLRPPGFEHERDRFPDRPIRQRTEAEHVADMAEVRAAIRAADAPEVRPRSRKKRCVK